MFVLFIYCKNCMATSESKGRFFLQNESIRIYSHNESNRIDSNRELECYSTDHIQSMERPSANDQGLTVAADVTPTTPNNPF